MRRQHRSILAIAAIAAVAACSGPATPDEALLRDLDQAQSASIELAHQWRSAWNL